MTPDLARPACIKALPPPITLTIRVIVLWQTAGTNLYSNPCAEHSEHCSALSKGQVGGALLIGVVMATMWNYAGNDHEHDERTTPEQLNKIREYFSNMIINEYLNPFLE